MMVTIAWYATVVGGLLAVAALALEHAASWARWPRRWPWAAALAGTVALTLWLPWRAPADASDVIAASAAGPLASATTIGLWWSRVLVATPGSAPFGVIDQLAFTVWAASSVVMMAIYTAGISSLRKGRSRWPATAIGPHHVVVSEDIGPAVIGFWSSTIVVPQWALTLEPRQLQLLLRHEQEHQAARDSVLIHVAEVAVATMPWNVAVWWMRGRLRAAVELDCDARVLTANQPNAGELPADPETYGGLLLTVASRRGRRSMRQLPALIERSSTLKRRIVAMQPITYRLIRSRVAAVSLVAAALVTAAAVLPVPVMHAQYDQKRGAYSDKTPDLVAPVLLKEQKPVYTSEAMRAKIQGEVEIEAVVTADGKVKDARVTKSLDKKYGLDEEALKAVRLWLFRPGTLKDKKVPVAVTLSMRFTLH